MAGDNTARAQDGSVAAMPPLIAPESTSVADAATSAARGPSENDPLSNTEPARDDDASEPTPGWAEALTEARDRIGKLLTALGIDAVISVDDVNYGGGQGTAAEVTEEMAGSDVLRGAVADVLRDHPDQGGFADVDEEDPAAIADFVNETWAGFPQALQEQLLGLTRTHRQDREESIDAGQIKDDMRSRVTLDEVFSGLVQFRSLSMTDWTAQWRDLVSDGQKYLVLFDRSFTREPSGGAESGDDLLNELLNTTTDNVRAGLLSRLASAEESERDLTNALREKFPQHADRIVAIGKFRTTTPSLLPAGLRALLLVHELRAYRELVGRALERAASKATEHFDSLTDYAIVESIAAAQAEGAFELDHPLRLTQRIHATELSRELRDVTFAGQHLAVLRGGAVGAFTNAEKDHAQIRDLRRADTFEPDGHVNELGLPLEIGDVFRFETWPAGGEPKHYILLGQACDLSVRSSGERSPDLSTVTLSRVAAVPPDQLGTRPPTKHGIGHMVPNSDEHWAVDLRAGYELVVPIEVLDATVFNVSGEAIITLGYVELRPMADGWLKRLASMQKRAKQVIKTYSKLADDLKKVSSAQKILDSVAADLTAGAIGRNGAAGKIDPTTNTISYGVRRVARVRASTAARIADVAFQYRSRPAFEADYIREPASVVPPG